MTSSNHDTMSEIAGVTNSLPDIINESAPAGISVLIIGAGMGGLTAARECRRLGCKVQVFEKQSHENLLKGDSFSIGPSALRSLRNYPSLQAEVNSLSLDPIVTIRNLQGDIIQAASNMARAMTKPVIDGEDGKTLLPQRHSRPKLYAAMLHHLRRVDVPVEHGIEVLDYHESIESTTTRPGITLKDGSTHAADLVIAADGINTSSWRVVLGQKVTARPSGDAVFRVAYPLDIALKDPVIAAFFPGFDRKQSNLHIFSGGDIQLIIAQFRDEMQWGIIHKVFPSHCHLLADAFISITRAWSNIVKDDGRAQESWESHPPVSNAVDLLDPFPQLPDAVRHVIQATPPGLVVDWRIMWRDPQPKWTSDSGRIIQIGDAAHTFHPNSGNGATQAIEDAVSLAKCLALAGSENVEWAARVSNLLRFKRVSCLQAFGIKQRESRKKGSGLGQMGRWITEHDPEAYVDERFNDALKHLQSGGGDGEFENTNTPPGMVYKPWTIDSLVDAIETGAPSILDGDWS